MLLENLWKSWRCGLMGILRPAFLPTLLFLPAHAEAKKDGWGCASPSVPLEEQLLADVVRSGASV